jgi:AraC-like DNA-binding protein
MDNAWIDIIGAVSGGETEHAPAAQPASTYWLSSGSNLQPVSYEADLPVGLHLGCGVTAGMISVAPFGHMDVQGAAATLVICTAPARMTTRLQPGPFHSAGLSLAAPPMGDFARLAAFARAEGDRVLTLEGIPLSVVTRLASPIDPWFQGAARAMVRDARALELLAVFQMALCGSCDAGGHRPRAHDIAMKARSIIEAEHTAPPALAQLAARLGCSPRTLTDAFRATFAQSIGAYLTRFRLEQAQRLMEQGMRPTQAAYRVGYSPAHFATAFKHQFGIAPSQWRHGLAGQRKRLPAATSNGD